MDDRQLLRFGRHLLLNEFGLEGQERLLSSTVLVVGAGGLGSAALLYLASAGVGRLIIADGDQVELSNLQRQVIHNEASIGCNKAESAARSIASLNSDCQVEVIRRRLEGAELDSCVARADAVLDCSDNFATRHAINRACVAEGVPLISGAAIRFDGQVASFDSRNALGPCYHCLFPEADDAEEVRCAVMGVFAPLVGIIGATQASETLRILAGIGEPLWGRLLLLDGLANRWHEVKLSKDPGCAVCAAPTTNARRVNHAHA